MVAYNAIEPFRTQSTTFFTKEYGLNYFKKLVKCKVIHLLLNEEFSETNDR